MATAAGKSIGFRVEIIIILLLAILSAFYWHKDSQWKERWSERDASDARATQQAQKDAFDASEAIRLRERQNAAESARIESELQEKLKREKDRANSAYDDYQRGIKRLRSQYNCAASSAASAVKDGSAATIGNEAAKCGLQPEDVRAFIRFGSDAEEVRLQLQAAQLELCNAYKTVNGQDLNYEVCKQARKEK